MSQFKIQRFLFAFTMLCFAFHVSSQTPESKTTDGAIPCNDVGSNKDAYGCGEEYSDEDSSSYKCLDKLSKFDVPLKDSDEQNVSFLKGEKVVAVPGDDKISFVDKKRKYQLPKEKIKEAISQKLGNKVDQSDEFSVQFQTPEGQVKLKVKKKSTSSGWDLGDVEVDTSKSELKDQVHIGIGLNDQISDDNDPLAALKNKITDKVRNFEENIEKKKEEVGKFYQDKEEQIEENSSLGTLEKIKMKRALREQKQAKLAELDLKKSKKEEFSRSALEDCRDDEAERFMTSSVLESGASQNSSTSTTVGSSR